MTLHTTWDCHCGGRYDTPEQLLAHYVEVHRTGGNADDQCPVCYRGIASYSMRRHLAQVHDLDLGPLPRGRSLRGRKDGAAPLRRTKAASSSIPVDGLVTTVLEYLFPKGMIPLSALEPLTRWRDATEKFLREISE